MPETTEPQAGTETAPPWSAEDFNPEKAWNLIEGLKADKAKLAARPVLTDEAQAKLAEHDRITKASQTELERQTAEATRWQTEAERWRTASVGNRIEALAGQDFADPSDAAAALSDPSKYLDAGGLIDEAQIKADLASLLEKKPHWRRPEGAPVTRVPAPNQSQGTSGNTPVASPAAIFGEFIRSNMQ